MVRLCIFCGSAPGNRPEFVAAAAELGRLAAQRGIGIVYGGAYHGMMGAVATAALEAGGEVIGVIPHWFTDEIAHSSLTVLERADSMADRKARMAELANSFVALPGGVGTLDELFEMITNRLLSLHDKPCAILNTDGYYDPLLEFIDQGAREGFIRERVVRDLIVASDPTTLLQLLHD